MLYSETQLLFWFWFQVLKVSRFQRRAPSHQRVQRACLVRASKMQTTLSHHHLGEVSVQIFSLRMAPRHVLVDLQVSFADRSARCSGYSVSGYVCNVPVESEALKMNDPPRLPSKRQRTGEARKDSEHNQSVCRHASLQPLRTSLYDLQYMQTALWRLATWPMQSLKMSAASTLAS